jgi:hypothetical protein
MQIVVSGSPASHLRLMQERATSGYAAEPGIGYVFAGVGGGVELQLTAVLEGRMQTSVHAAVSESWVGSRLATTPPDVYPHGDQSRSDADLPRCEIAEYAIWTRNTQNMTDPELMPGNPVSSSIRIFGDPRPWSPWSPWGAGAQYVMDA